jgi:hypothetical protein
VRFIFLISKWILCGHLHPVQVLPAHQLVKEFKMSRLLASRAFRLLQDVKFAESRLRGGAVSVCPDCPYAALDAPLCRCLGLRPIEMMDACQKPRP